MRSAKDWAAQHQWLDDAEEVEAVVRVVQCDALADAAELVKHWNRSGRVSSVSDLCDDIRGLAHDA